MGHQEIKCNVKSCKFNDHAAYCTLNNIVVGNDTPSGEPHTKHETECASFDCEC